MFLVDSLLSPAEEACLFLGIKFFPALLSHERQPIITVANVASRANVHSRATFRVLDVRDPYFSAPELCGVSLVFQSSERGTALHCSGGARALLPLLRRCIHLRLRA